MSQTFCTQCGTKLPEEGNFCPQCGAAVDAPVQASTAASPPASEPPVATDPAAQLDAELAAASSPPTRAASGASTGASSSGSRTLWYALGGVAAIAALLAVVYFAFLRPDDLSDCGDEPCSVEELVAAAQSGGAGAQDAAANSADIPYPEIARISADEAHIRLMQGEAVIVDVRDRDSYTNMHIPGALSIPLDEIDLRMGELPRDAEIITYCT